MFNKRCQIIAFEPNPIMFTKAELRYRGDSRITIHNVGLSAEHSNKTLFVPKYRATYFDELASFDSESARNWFSEGRLIGFDHRLISLAEFQCNLTTLDAYALSPFLMKIDVQGYEKQVLQGAWSTIMRCRPILLIENDKRSSAEMVKGLVSKAGYLPYRFVGGKLRQNEFGLPNTFYVVPNFERGLEQLIAQK